MPNDYAPLIARTAKKYGLPINVLTALVKQESGFDARAVSPAGAQGLTQLMPATARGLGVKDPFDPVQNLEGGARYLSQQLKQFGSLDRALAAYNAGPGAVSKYGGIPPFAETRNYVKSILGNLAGVAQPAEQLPARQKAAGSIPAARSDRRQAALQFVLGDDLASLLAPSAAALPASAPAARGKTQPKAGKIKGLVPTFERQLAALMAAVRAQGGNLEVSSGFRSVAHQRELWNAALKKYGSAAAARKWVAPPGRSNHNKGIAADLRGDLELAAKLAPQFGLYRPMDHEPWHFEPQGSRG